MNADCAHCTAAASRPWGFTAPGCKSCEARKLARSPQAHQAFIAKRFAHLDAFTREQCAAAGISADQAMRDLVQGWWDHDHSRGAAP